MIYTKSIALIICYYGKMPWYFDYFLHTLKYNPSVDLFLITDIPVDEPSLPPNVKLIRMTLAEVSLLATEKLGFNVEITKPYKLSEFKPACGYLFSHLLAGYDFWAPVDIDVVYGDIRAFISEDLLSRYDIISARPDWMPGCFTLYKNTDKINTLFKRSKHYQSAFTSGEYLNFDETGFRHRLFKEGKTYLEITDTIESMLHVVQKMTAEKELDPLFDFFMIEGLPGKLKWRQGKLYYKNKFEVLLYHMMYLKDIYQPGKRKQPIPDCFYISTNRIYHKPIPKSAVYEL